MHLGITPGELMTPLVPFRPFFVFFVQTAAQTNRGNTMAIYAFGMLIAQHVSSPTHPFFIADKHHELSGRVLSPLHPAHPLRLVQEAERA